MGPDKSDSETFARCRRANLWPIILGDMIQITLHNVLAALKPMLATLALFATAIAIFYGTDVVACRRKR